VRVGISEMMREGIPKRRASMSKTSRGKSNVDTRLGEEIKGVVKPGSQSSGNCALNTDYELNRISIRR